METNLAINSVTKYNPLLKKQFVEYLEANGWEVEHFEWLGSTKFFKSGSDFSLWQKGETIDIMQWTEDDDPNHCSPRFIHQSSYTGISTISFTNFKWMLHLWNIVPITPKDLLAFQIQHYRNNLVHERFQVRSYARKFLHRLKSPI